MSARLLPRLPQWRHFSSIVREELTVQTFCDINVKVPYNVKIKPLDVHKYHNSDLLRIELDGVPGGRQTVKHIQDGNNIQIFACMDNYDQNTTCCIHAPVKANLSVKSHGNISTGVFSGSKLILKSTRGNIFVNKFQGETIDLSTENGNILMKGAVVASNIHVVTTSGSIKAKRLQGLTAILKTIEGDMTIDAAYCDDGTFETSRGDLILQNIHKNSKIVQKGGTLSLTGFDGQLEADLEDTEADIQISRVSGDSRIRVGGDGALILRLSEECQENTMFEIDTLKHTLDPDIKLVPSRTDGILHLKPTSEYCKTVKVACEGEVQIQNASWINMLKLKKD